MHDFLKHPLHISIYSYMHLSNIHIFFSEKHHTVVFEDPSCTCRYWIEWNLPRKHFFCVFEHYPLWNWYSLLDQYTKKTNTFLLPRIIIIRQ